MSLSSKTKLTFSFTTRIIFILAIQVFAGSFLITTPAAKTIIVGAEDSSFKTIDGALKACSADDTIIVQSGLYKESELIIDQPITLIGKGWPIIDGSSGGTVLTITASNVIIEGLDIRNSQISFIEDNAALLLEKVNQCTIRNNRFHNNFFAIYLAASYDCSVTGNEIISSAKTESRSGNGIHLWYCRNIVVDSNYVSGHRDGIYFEFVKFSEITRNRSEENLRYGLHFMFSDSCAYIGNKFLKNGAGVAVMYTHFVKMKDNEFSYNWGTSSYGLLLKEITDSEISGNKFYKNSIGIYIEGCTRLNVVDNSLIENGWGLRLMSNSVDNIFSKNNFIGNTFQVGSSGRQNFSTFSENYWSDYYGYDLDHDGVGDVPFRPVTLFSVVVEKNPPTLALVHSLTVEIINLAERMFPSLTPETLIDDRPLMEPLL